jgi:hypothetical protein
MQALEMAGGDMQEAAEILLLNSATPGLSSTPPAPATALDSAAATHPANAAPAAGAASNHVPAPPTWAW